MTGRNNKKLFMFAISIVAIIVGIYMTFIHRKIPEEKDTAMYTEKAEQERKAGGRLETENSYDYTGKVLPTEENDSNGDLYNGGKVNVEVYFSNTELLDTSDIPLNAQSILCSEVQAFLMRRGYDDVTELYIDDESAKVEDGITSFECFMDGHAEKLLVEYRKEEAVLKYYIVDEKEGGTYEE